MKHVLTYFLLANNIATAKIAKVAILDEKVSAKKTEQSFEEGIKDNDTFFAREVIRSRFGTKDGKTSHHYLKGNLIDSRRRTLQCLKAESQDEKEEHMGTPAEYWGLDSISNDASSDGFDSTFTGGQFCPACDTEMCAYYCVKSTCEEAGGKVYEVDLSLTCSDLDMKMKELPLCRVDSCSISNYILYMNIDMAAFWGESTRKEDCSYELKVSRHIRTNVFFILIFVFGLLGLSCVCAFSIKGLRSKR